LRRYPQHVGVVVSARLLRCNNACSSSSSGASNLTQQCCCRVSCRAWWCTEGVATPSESFNQGGATTILNKKNLQRMVIISGSFPYWTLFKREWLQYSNLELCELWKGEKRFWDFSIYLKSRWGMHLLVSKNSCI